MGKVIAVDSVVYNMAGDQVDRPSYLKTLVAQNALSGSSRSMADVIRDGYSASPALKLKLFYNWAKKSGNYGQVGMPSGRLEVSGVVPANKVAAEIPAATGFTVKVRSASVGYANPRYWAERFILDNFPGRYGDAWEADYLPGSAEIRIDFPGHSTETFSSASFDYEERYVYARYSKVNDTTGDEGDTKIFIYKIGSGNADLDALAENKADYGEFFPFIPVRLDNKFLSTSYKPAAFEQTKKAYTKAIGGDLKELIEQLKDNDSLDDIDYAFVTFGVSLNTRDNSARKYVYQFFKNLQLYQEGGATAYEDWLANFEEHNKTMASYDAWKSMNKLGAEPARGYVSAPFTNKIRIRGTGDINSSYDVRINWNYITSNLRKGRGKPGAKAGDFWFTATRIVVGQTETMVNSGPGEYTTHYDPVKSTRLRLFWQRSREEYEFLDVIGAEYENVIYKGKSVVIDAKDALADADDSGFIVPLHYDTWAAMSMIDRTQMATACVYTVFNCYEVHKTKWYESGIFQIFLVIVIAIASALFTGGAGLGLLGSNLAIGTAFGLSGISAAIMGSVVNALAALVLTTIISKVAQGFGAFGALFSALVGIVIGSAMSAINSGSLALNWSDFLRVDNLLKLTQAVGNTAVSLIQEDTMNIAEKWADFQENANEQALKIQQAFFNEFGYGAAIIDPMMLTDTSVVPMETSDAFLTRTLMTGSEIAEMSQELLSEFPKYSLQLPDAFSQ